MKAYKDLAMTQLAEVGDPVLAVKIDERPWEEAMPKKKDLQNNEERNPNCHAHQDGECNWEHCPQTKDNEPAESGRSCPLHWAEEDNQ